MTSELTELVGVDAPIVLGPFGGLSSVELTAGVSNLGGLGSFGLYGYDAARIAETVEDIRERTSKPFALNLWVPHDEVQPSQVSPDEFAVYIAALESFFREVGLEPPAQPDRYLPSFEEQVGAALDARPAVLSFVFGMPPLDVVAEAHARGIVVLGTATTVEEAQAVEAGGADAVVATGAEAAGHRVSFLARAEDSLVGTFALVPQVADAVDVPVIAAGGIAERRGVRAALALGAAGVQVGTAFLVTRQSAVNDAHRQAIRDAPAHGTVLTRAMSGRLARGIPNRVVRSIEQGGVIAPFPVQNWLTGRFRAEATKRGLADLQSLWAGQAGPLARHSEMAEVFAELSEGLLLDGRAG